ncbi:MAG: DNA-binding response regulator [Firmicutes bacterium HGW-Firmicutes-1]|nr:MAG: DNA-binding response regulator [Firmicutes bacterium HGW-Firmicutes-1]
MGIILIVEDDLNIRSGLVEIVRNIDEHFDVFETGAAVEALKIAETKVVDAFFFDIQLEDYTGLELAMQIREIDHYKFTPIIFITGDHCSEIEAFKNIHCYEYILKPFTENEVIKVFQDVITHGIVEKKSDPKLGIKEKDFTYVINQGDLIYVEMMNRNLYIKTIHEETDIRNCSLSKLLKQLTNQFIQCHKSFIVNRSYIKKIDKANNLVYVEKKEEPIPIGRKYRDNVLQLLDKTIKDFVD